MLAQSSPGNYNNKILATWLAAVALLLMCVAAVVLALRTSTYQTREQLFWMIACALGVSPLGFAILPSNWLAWPRCLLLTWWILPICTACAAMSYVDDMGDRGHFATPLAVLIASFWSMFSPVVVVGMRRKS